MNFTKPIILAAFVLISSACMEERKLNTEHLGYFSSKMEVFENQVKSTLGEYNTVTWLKDDCISIFYGSTRAERYIVADYCAGSPNGEFYPADDTFNGFLSGNEINNNIAIYPYSSDHTCYGPGLTEGNQHSYSISGVRLPEWQYYSENSFPDEALVMMAVTRDISDKTLIFRNVCGVIRFQLYGTGIIRRLTLYGNSDEPLAGDVCITGGHDMIPSVEFQDTYYGSITLDCGDGVALNWNNPTAFCMAVPPVCFENGFTVVVEDMEGNTQTLETNQPNEVRRSGILVMPEIEISLSGDIAEDVTIAEALERSDRVCIEGTVTAVSDRGVILSDETADVYVYYGTSSYGRYSIGDVLNICGHMSIYYHGYEFMPSSTGVHPYPAEVEYGEPADLDSHMVDQILNSIHKEGEVAIRSRYVQFEGYVINQKYLRMADSDELIDLFHSNWEISQDILGLTYQKVRIRGYLYGLSSSTYPCLIPTHMEPIGNESGDINEAMGPSGVTFTGVVAATSRKGYILTDGVNNKLIFHSTLYHEQFKIGDMIIAKGITKPFDYGSEIFHYHDEYLSSDSTYTFPEAKTITAEDIDRYIMSAEGLTPYKDSVIPCERIQVSGTLMIEGSTYNILVEGTQNGVNIFNPDAKTRELLSGMNGQPVILTGYTQKITNGTLLAVVFSSIEPEVLQ